MDIKEAARPEHRQEFWTETSMKAFILLALFVVACEYDVPLSKLEGYYALTGE